MGNPNKDSDGTMGANITSPWDSCQALLNERSTAVISTSLKVTSRASGFKVMDPFDLTKDKLSTRDGKCGQRRLDTPLMLWKVIQKRLKFHTFTTGLMVKEWGKLNPGRTIRSSLARRNMTDWRTKKASTLQKK